jgi:hypothetical protein
MAILFSVHLREGPLLSLLSLLSCSYTQPGVMYHHDRRPGSHSVTQSLSHACVLDVRTAPLTGFVVTDRAAAAAEAGDRAEAGESAASSE